MVETAPPTVPSHVLLGEIRGNSGVFPKNFPKMKAKVSFVQIRRNMQKNNGAATALSDSVTKNQFSYKLIMSNKNGNATYKKPKIETEILSNGFGCFRQSSVSKRQKNEVTKITKDKIAAESPSDFIANKSNPLTTTENVALTHGLTDTD